VNLKNGFTGFTEAEQLTTVKTVSHNGGLKPFDLTNDPRCAKKLHLWQWFPSPHILLINIHHIISYRWLVDREYSHSGVIRSVNASYRESFT